MFHSRHHKSKQFFFVILKLSIVASVAYFIYKRLLKNEQLDFNAFIIFLNENHLLSFENVFFLIFLSCFNWCFEILKWQNLVNSISSISFFNALEQSLGGLTASLITPNRIGEYGAKAIYYKKAQRKQIVLLNFISNVAQMSITTLLGSLALLFFTKDYNIGMSPYKLILFGVILMSIVIIFYLGLKQLSFRIKGFSIDRIILFVKEEIPLKIHLKNFGLSFARYAVFSFQFYYLLVLFGIDISYFKAMTAISSMYLLASIIPSLALFDVVIKTGAAIFIFSAMGISELTILSITTLMWLLNFILPSLFGSYFILNFSLPKSDD